MTVAGRPAASDPARSGCRAPAPWVAVIATLVLAALILSAAAWLRGAEYDEQYTLFLTAGTARPAWPVTPFPAATVAAAQGGHAGLGEIAISLRQTDVHPPLYFWAVSLWRAALGPSLFAARLFSVLCGLVSLALVGGIARRCGIRPAGAMLLTLGSYGFAYTAIIARGFAPALALTLGAVWLLAGRRRPGALVGAGALLGAGALFGAAAACNYLAVFVAIGVGLAGCIRSRRHWLLLPGAVPFLALDAWFFAAQHGARNGQFPPFALSSALPRLAGYQLAALFGGLPLYADGPARPAIGAAIAALGLLLAATVLSARPWAASFRVRLLAAAAVAPPIGLLALGAVFDNTPIELRYLSFGVPFLALLLAWACGRRRGAWPLPVLAGAVQAAAILGLALAPATMQPAGRAAWQAARLGDGVSLADGVVALVPLGNDGVGIVGAFGIEAPPALPLLVVRPADTAADLRPRITPYRRVVLALLGQDRDSTATLPAMRQAVAGPGWRRIAAGSTTEAYERE